MLLLEVKFKKLEIECSRFEDQFRVWPHLNIHEREREREREREILFFLIIFLFNEVYFQVMQHVLNGPN